MRVERLELSRGYYEDKPLQGSITLKDANGSELKVNLTPAGISRLVASISTEVISTLRETAKQVPQALKRCEDEGYLLENNGNIDLEGN